MLSKCANPGCSHPFLYLHEGKLFRVDVPRQQISDAAGSMDIEQRKLPQRVEYFWLCDSCASHLTIVRTNNGVIRAAPLLAFGVAHG